MCINQSRPKASPRLTLNSGTIAALHTGTLTLIPSPDSLLADYPTTKVLDPITCIASSGPSSTQVAMAGKNVDLCIYDVERLFASDRVNASRKLGAKGNTRGLMKEWNPLEDGEVWRAKNVRPFDGPPANLQTHFLASKH